MHIVQDQGLGRSRLLEIGRVQTDAGATSMQRCTRVTLVLGDAGVATLLAAADEGIRCRPLSGWKAINPFTFASWYSAATLIQFTCRLSSSISSYSTSNTSADFSSVILFRRCRSIPIVMCQHTPVDKIAIPCMNDSEGFTTMPVRLHLLLEARPL
jgi:hypothetical protein